MNTFRAHVLYTETESISGIVESHDREFESMGDAWSFATKLNTTKSQLVTYTQVRIELDFNAPIVLKEVETAAVESDHKTNLLNILMGE